MKRRIIKVGNEFKPQYLFFGICWLDYFTIGENVVTFKSEKDCKEMFAEEDELNSPKEIWRGE
jgi:hypothetical protein